MVIWFHQKNNISVVHAPNHPNPIFPNYFSVFSIVFRVLVRPFLLALDFGAALGALPEPGVLDGFALDFGAALKVLMWEEMCETGRNGECMGIHLEWLNC